MCHCHMGFQYFGHNSAYSQPGDVKLPPKVLKKPTLTFSALIFFLVSEVTHGVFREGPLTLVQFTIMLCEPLFNCPYCPRMLLSMSILSNSLFLITPNSAIQLNSAELFLQHCRQYAQGFQMRQMSSLCGLSTRSFFLYFLTIWTCQFTIWT